MRILHFIPDDQTRSKVQTLAEARHQPVPRCEGPWVIFEAVNEPEEEVLLVLQAAGVAVPALEVAPVPKGGGARRSRHSQRRS